MLLETKSATKKNNDNSDVEQLDSGDMNDEGFIEGSFNAGKVLRAFSFGMNAAPVYTNTTTIKAPVLEKTNEILSTQTQSYPTAPRGLTPPINGEQFTVKRSYAMRPSTVRKLNELKAQHPDVNVLFNTIVDMAVSHYYNYIFNEKGTFGAQEEKNITS